MRLILASGSPRRAAILRNAGLEFDVRVAGVDESRLGQETPEEYVRRLAEAKALAVAALEREAGERAVVIGADTTVVAGGAMLEKPVDADDARRMLRLLSGRSHEVLTGVALVRVPDRERISFVESTRVIFASLTDEQIDSYIATGEPFDKAGAYGIQAIGGKFIPGIEGCYFNVMGLPLSRVWKALEAMGWDGASK